MTLFQEDILSLHLFLNTEALLLGEEPCFMTLTRGCDIDQEDRHD